MDIDDFSTVVEDRRYINPQVGLDESNAFIEKLRESQQAGTQEIAQDTYNLGTAVPSNLGGLGGAGSYFTSRYQTPQTNEVIANLRSTAQAQALNEAMSNKLAQAKEQYSQAYRNYQKRARSAALSGGSGAPATTGGGLKIGTNDTNNTTKLPGTGSDTVAANTWAGAPYKSSIYRYRNNGLEWYYDSSAPLRQLPSMLSPNQKDGTLKKVSGKTYISMNGQWYPVVKSPL